MNTKWTVGITVLLALLMLVGCNQSTIDTPLSTNNPQETNNPILEIGNATPTLTQSMPTNASREELTKKSTPEVRYDPALELLVEQAKRDLAHRLNISEDQITLLEAKAVLWPDASLGCPQPDMVYQQITYEGVFILLQAGEREYDYHSGGSRDLFLCEKSLKTKKITPNTDKVIPPPRRSGGE